MADGTERNGVVTQPGTALSSVEQAIADFLGLPAVEDWPSRRVSVAPPSPIEVVLLYPELGLDPLSGEAPPGWPHTVVRRLNETPGALGEVLEHQPPSELLGRFLAGIDPEETDDFSVVEVVAAYKRMEAYAARRAARAAASLAQREALNPTRPGTVRGRTHAEQLAAHEVACRLVVSRHAAQHLVSCGRGFAGMFWLTGELLEQGLIDYPRAQLIVSTLEPLPAEVAAAVQEEVIDTAPGRTLRQLREDLAKAIIAVDPDSADERHRSARSQRRVNHPRALPDGMAAMTAVLPAVDAVALDAALEAAARAAKNVGDSRTLDQLRADSLALMGHTALTLGAIGPCAATCTCGCGSTDAPESVSGAGRAPGVDPPEGAGLRTMPPCSSAPDPAPPVPIGRAPVPPGATAPEILPRGSPAPGPVPPGAPATESARPDPVPPGLTDPDLCLPRPDASDPAPGSSCPDADIDPAPRDRHKPPAGPALPGEGSSGETGDTAQPAGRSPVEPAECGAHPRAPGEGGDDANAPVTPRTRRYADGPPRPGARVPCGLPTIRLGLLGGGRADIRVTVPLDVLLPDPETRGLPALDRDPEPVADLEGYGPIPPLVARALAEGGVWRRLVTDPTGTEVLDVGRTRYQPTAAIADHVRERDRTCIEPSCSTPARSCELDHIHEWQHGGTTSASNLGPLCTRGHPVKSVGAFTVARTGDGAYAWTTPTDHGYLRRPDGTVTRLDRETSRALRALCKQARRPGAAPVRPDHVDALLAA